MIAASALLMPLPKVAQLRSLQGGDFDEKSVLQI
jgi:hypothetical protein